MDVTVEGINTDIKDWQDTNAPAAMEVWPSGMLMLGWPWQVAQVVHGNGSLNGVGFAEGL